MVIRMAFISIAIIVFAVISDQLSKAYMTSFLDGGSISVIDGVFNFTAHENRGAFLGSFSENRWVFMSVSVIAIAAMIAILIYVLIKVKTDRCLLLISLSMLIGGGIGNMIDRFRLGYVFDFIDVSAINFPVFNIADSFVTIGTGLLIIYLIMTEVKSRKDKKESVRANDGTDDE